MSTNHNHDITNATGFLPPIDIHDEEDAEFDDEENDMPPGVMVDDNDMPPGIMVAVHDDEALERPKRTQGTGPDDTATATDSYSSGPLTFNYTFLPDMSLATATTSRRQDRSGANEGTLATRDPESFDSGTGSTSDQPANTNTILSVAYPAYQTAYPSPTPYSHIPRPPNAFILFRSAFIKSRKISSEIEGNHSTLSKIIGRVWRALPPPERAEWEARARLAQDEHRARYPDWRFSPAGAGPGGGGNTKGNARGKAKGSRGRGRGRGRGRLKVGEGGAGAGGGEPSGSGSTAAETANTIELTLPGASYMDVGGAFQPPSSPVYPIRLLPPLRPPNADDVPGSGLGSAPGSPQKESATAPSIVVRDAISGVPGITGSSQPRTRKPSGRNRNEIMTPTMAGTADATVTSTFGKGKGKEREQAQFPHLHEAVVFEHPAEHPVTPVDSTNPPNPGPSIVVTTATAPNSKEGATPGPFDTSESSAAATAKTSEPSGASAAVEEARTRKVDAIADMLAQGYEGHALDVAFKRWERWESGEKERGRGKEREKERGRKGKGKAHGNESATIEQSGLGGHEPPSEIDGTITPPPVLEGEREEELVRGRRLYPHPMPNSDSIPDLGGAESFWVGSYEREQDRERKGEGEAGLSSGKLDVPGRSPSGQVEIPSSRSSSSNETERERGRAGGEWGMFDVQDDSSAVAHNNFGSANPGAAVPLTRMFLKRSLSEPAAPRPTRPRLEEGVEFAGAGGAAEFGWTGNYHEEDPDHHATIYPQPHQVLNLPGSSTFTRHHTYPAPSGGAELAYHHSFSYPNQHPNTNPNLNPQEAGYPGPGEPVIHRLHVPPASAWITPRAQVLGSPGTEASSPSPTPSSTGSPMTAYTAVPLSRSNSTSSPSVPLSAPLPFPSDTSATATASLQPHPRRRAWTTRSNPGPEKTPPMFLSPAAASGSGSAAAHNNVDPTKYGGYQRPMSRASPPPLSPTSPADHAHSHVSNLGNLGNSGRNVSFFSRPTHRKTLTWGERWTTPPQSDSPAPAPSLPPLMTTTPEISETVPGYGFTWQQVETQRRMELDYGEEGDENARSAGGMKERKEVDTQRLMSTERMGWQQDTGEEVPLMWRVPQRPPSPGPELVGYSSTENADSVSLNSSSKLSWSPANAGYTGYVASILDPHLPNPNIDSGQNHLVEAQAHPNESVPPSHFAQVPSSSYSTLSGWAGTESSKEPRVPQHEGAIGHPVMMVPPNSYSSSFFDRSKERQGEWDTISNTTLYPFDSSGASRTHGWDPSSSS